MIFISRHAPAVGGVSPVVDEDSIDQVRQVGRRSRPRINGERTMAVTNDLNLLLADYHVDGVSGATLTGNGVTNLIQYWLGPRGYGPYLRNIQRGEAP